MLAFLIVMVTAFVEAAAIGFFLLEVAKKLQGTGGSMAASLREELAKREKLAASFKSCTAQMVDSAQVRMVLEGLQIMQEALRAERGRTTITQAELDTVEGRLRELEEIERELEASGIEAQEEMKILQKKEAELKEKNQRLADQIALVNKQMEDLIGKAEFSAQVQEQVTVMKTDLLRSEEEIQVLVMKIEAGNEQYFVMKKRYDALDIEYAQLYERFSETEAMGTAKT